MSVTTLKSKTEATTFQNMSIYKILENMSNSILGIFDEMYKGDAGILEILQREQRIMYITLLFIIILVVGDLVQMWDLRQN